jgi:hypothetical protein
MGAPRQIRGGRSWWPLRTYISVLGSMGQRLRAPWWGCRVSCVARRKALARCIAVLIATGCLLGLNVSPGASQPMHRAPLACCLRSSASKTALRVSRHELEPSRSSLAASAREQQTIDAIREFGPLALVLAAVLGLVASVLGVRAAARALSAAVVSQHTAQIQLETARVEEHKAEIEFATARVQPRVGRSGREPPG